MSPIPWQFFCMLGKFVLENVVASTGLISKERFSLGYNRKFHDFVCYNFSSPLLLPFFNTKSKCFQCVTIML